MAVEAVEPGASRLIFLALSVRAGRRFDLHGTRGSAWWPPLPGSGVIVSLGAARVLRRWETDCNPDFTAYVHVELFDKKSEDANITAHFQNAGLPILYFEHDGNTREWPTNWSSCHKTQLTQLKNCLKRKSWPERRCCNPLSNFKTRR